MVDPKFRNINRLFAQLFETWEYNPTRNFFAKYYMSPLQIKDFNALTDNNPFFDQHTNKQEASRSVKKQ